MFLVFLLVLYKDSEADGDIGVILQKIAQIASYSG